MARQFMDISKITGVFKLMKRVTPILLTAFSVFALSFSATSGADNTDSDGFITFGAQTTEEAPAAATETTETEVAEQTPAASASESPEQAVAVVEEKPKAKKKVAKKAKKSNSKARKRTQRANRAKRAARQKRIARAKARRNKNLRKASSYRVRKGDTLYRISVKHRVKLSSLVRLNKLHGSKKHNIQAGQKLRIR